jgi:uncharacterized protein (TIGR02996 family)
VTITREQLLRAAYASVDDTERLVYADWLEQNGHVLRAQVIHLQCRIAKTGPYDRERSELQWELDAVFDELGTKWTNELPALDGIEWIALERGLPSAVRARNFDALYAAAGAIIAAAPTVTCVEMPVHVSTAEPPALPWLRTLRVSGAMGANPILAAPAELEIATSLYDEVWLQAREAPLERLVVIDNATFGNELVTSLTTMEAAAHLKTLEIPTSRADQQQSYYEADPRLTRESVAQLATLWSLEVLDVSRHDIRTIDELSKLPKLRRLRARDCGIKKLSTRLAGLQVDELDLSQNTLGTAGAHVLGRLETLQRLELDTCEIDSTGLLALIRSPMWQSLRWLDLSRNPLGTAGARALAEAPQPAQLHTLLLADVDLEDAAAEVVGKIPWLGELSQLDLSGNPMRRGLAMLRNITGDRIRKLSLAHTGMERSEAAALGRFWARLVHLDLAGNPLGDAAIERFAGTREAAALQTLRLADCNLGDLGLELLAAARCPRLRVLDLAGNTIGPGAIAELLQAPCMQRVSSLDLSRCKVTGDALAVLAKTRVPPSLARLDLRGIEFTEQQLVMLADSPTLATIAKIQLEGNPFNFHPTAGEKLARRFGAGWYHRV